VDHDANTRTSFTPEAFPQKQKKRVFTRRLYSRRALTLMVVVFTTGLQDESVRLQLIEQAAEYQARRASLKIRFLKTRVTFARWRFAVAQAPCREHGQTLPPRRCSTSVVQSGLLRFPFLHPRANAREIRRFWRAP